MGKNCAVCGEVIEETFLNKINGTVVKLDNKGVNDFFYACSSCQKKFGRKLKEEVKNATR
jgi:uncharacterized protein with PIN domain